MWINHLGKSQTTPTSSITRGAIHKTTTRLLLRPRWANQVAACGCEVPTNLYCGMVFYNEKKKTIRQHSISHVTTFETWHNQYWHSTRFSSTNDTCRIGSGCCPLTHHRNSRRILPPCNITLKNNESLIRGHGSTPSSTPISTISNPLVPIRSR